MQAQRDITRKLPKMIAVRTARLAPLLEKWGSNNPHVPWSVLLDKALRGASPLVGLAGKRHAHLVNGKERAA